MDQPEVKILSPATNSTLNLPDKLEVVAEIRDDRNIEYVSVFLADGNGIQVIPPEYRYPGGTFYRYSDSISILDKTITGGTYWVTVVAFDGENSSRDYVPVTLYEIPQELLGYIAVTASLPFETRIIRYDRDFQEDTSFIVPMGFHLSGFSGLWEQFFFVSPGPSVIYAYSDRAFEPLWEFPCWLPRPEFTGLIADQDLLFSTMNGDAGILNANGHVTVLTGQFMGYSVDCFAADESYLYAEMVSLSGDQREMTAFYRKTGNLRSRRIIQDDVVGLEPIQGKVLMISRSAPGWNISEFDPESLEFTDLNSFEAGNVNASLEIYDETVLILTEIRVIQYEYPSNRLSEFIPGNYAFGRYDHQVKAVYLARDSAVDIVTPISSIPATVTFEEPLKDFHLVYNKK
jgi:hypothetical protein